MDIRTQIATVFHLDKCIGCHTCSVLCKNTWTDRKGAEYMWWNNVEAKPGTGYPSKWEDQEIYKGG
ncbi:MAG: nitrate reductase subunit beta, partial [Elusimicrobiota bacterium]